MHVEIMGAVKFPLLRYRAVTTQARLVNGTVAQDRMLAQLSIEHLALWRFWRSGLIAAKWGTSSTNRRARYYRLTSTGRKRLAVERSRWEHMAAAITRVMRPA